jgi:hypothetical protein
MKPQLPEKTRVALDISKVLERLGLLVRTGNDVDFAQSLVYPYSASDHESVKVMRYSLAGREAKGSVAPDERPAALRKVAEALASVTYESGAPVLTVREEPTADADFVIEVHSDQASHVLLVGGAPFPGAIKRISSISGNHTANDDGILLAAGPDFASGVDLDVSIHGVGPTVLYALGLPVAEDALSAPYLELFKRSFRKRHPVQTIRSWGTREGGQVTTSSADAELVDELRKIGYLR